MNIMLETKAIIPSVVNVKNGTESMNRLFNRTSSRTILATTYSQMRKELNQSVKNNAFRLLTV
jgi:hypothetical protein